MGPGDVREAGENRTWTAHPADQTDQSPHRDLREYSRDGESASTGEFVNSLLTNWVAVKVGLRRKPSRARRDRRVTAERRWGIEALSTVGDESRRAWTPRREAYCRRDAKKSARATAESSYISPASGHVAIVFCSLSGRGAQVRGLPGEEEQQGVLIVIGPPDHGWR